MKDKNKNFLLEEISPEYRKQVLHSAQKEMELLKPSSPLSFAFQWQAVAAVALFTFFGFSAFKWLQVNQKQEEDELDMIASGDMEMLEQLDFLEDYEILENWDEIEKELNI